MISPTFASYREQPAQSSIATRPDGLVVATGFNGLGIMLSPMVGPLARWLVEDSPDDPPLPHSPFALDRFDDLTAEFSLRSTSDL